MPGLNIAGIDLDVHTLVIATMCIFLGYQAVLFSVTAKTFAITEGLLPADPGFANLFRYFTLERGLITGVVLSIAGLCLIGLILQIWYQTGFGNLNYKEGLRLTIPGALLVTLGFQTILSSLLLSIIGMRRR